MILIKPGINGKIITSKSGENVNKILNVCVFYCNGEHAKICGKASLNKTSKQKILKFFCNGEYIFVNCTERPLGTDFPHINTNSNVKYTANNILRR